MVFPGRRQPEGIVNCHKGASTSVCVSSILCVEIDPNSSPIVTASMSFRRLHYTNKQNHHRSKLLRFLHFASSSSSSTFRSRFGVSHILSSLSLHLSVCPADDRIRPSCSFFTLKQKPVSAEVGQAAEIVNANQQKNSSVSKKTPASVSISSLVSLLYVIAFAMIF